MSSLGLVSPFCYDLARQGPLNLRTTNIDLHSTFTAVLPPRLCVSLFPSVSRSLLACVRTISTASRYAKRSTRLFRACLTHLPLGGSNQHVEKKRPKLFTKLATIERVSKPLKFSAHLEKRMIRSKRKISESDIVDETPVSSPLVFLYFHAV